MKSGYEIQGRPIISLCLVLYNMLESILDEEIEFEEKTDSLITLDYINKIYNENIGPKPGYDGLGRLLQEGDFVMYSERNSAPRIGKIIKLNNDLCAISYDGSGEDCKNLRGEIVCKEETYKCLKINRDLVLQLIYSI